MEKSRENVHSFVSENTMIHFLNVYPVQEKHVKK